MNRTRVAIACFLLMALPVARAPGGASRCDTEIMDAEDPLYLLYTSGTTGKPKAILHTHGGYMVGIATTLPMRIHLAASSIASR